MKTAWQLIHRSTRLLAATAVACGTGLALAQPTEEAPPNLLFSGFGTIGASKASTNFGGTFARDVSQVPGPSGLQLRPDTRVGAQINWRATDTLEAVGQVVLRDRPDSAQSSDSIEWAFVAYRPTPDTTLRVGRLNADLYLLSDFRNVGYGYLSVRPPPDFYGVMSMNNLDGLDISHNWRMGDADWRVKATAGASRYDMMALRSRFNDARGLTLSRDNDGLTLRGTLATGHLSVNLPGLELLQQGLSQVALAPVASVAAQAKALSSALNFQDIRARYVALGLAYDKHDWLVNAEWMRISTSNQAISGTGTYVMAGRRLGAFTPYVGLSRARSLSAAATAPNWARDLMPLAPVIGMNAVAQAQAVGDIATGVLNTYRVDQHTRTLGVRWDIRPNLSLKAQWDWITVRPLGGVMWGGNSNGGSANVGSVALDFVY